MVVLRCNHGQEEQLQPIRRLFIYTTDVRVVDGNQGVAWERLLDGFETVVVLLACDTDMGQ